MAIEGDPDAAAAATLHRSAGAGRLATLNVLMLVQPHQTIKAWQSGMMR